MGKPFPPCEVPPSQARKEEHSNETGAPESPPAVTDGRTLGYAAYGSTQGYPVLHFHAAGSSRLEHPVIHAASPITAVRLLVIDRPGHGLSSFQPQRTLLGWPHDVTQLADHLGLEQFAVTGWSAGGPHALACAYCLPERVKAVALLCGGAPLDYPGAFRGLPLPNRILAWSARYLPWLVYQQRRILGKGITGEPSQALRLLKATLPQVDQSFLERAGVAEMILNALREGYRQGLSTAGSFCARIILTAHVSYVLQL